MKKLMYGSLLLLTACANQPVSQSQPIMDMQAVAEYNQKIRTAQRNVPQQPAEPEAELPLNVSDSRPKYTRSPEMPILFIPSVGYHYQLNR